MLLPLSFIIGKKQKQISFLKIEKKMIKITQGKLRYLEQILRFTMVC